MHTRRSHTAGGPAERHHATSGHGAVAGALGGLTAAALLGGVLTALLEHLGLFMLVAALAVGVPAGALAGGVLARRLGPRLPGYVPSALLGAAIMGVSAIATYAAVSDMGGDVSLVALMSPFLAAWCSVPGALGGVVWRAWWGSPTAASLDKVVTSALLLAVGWFSAWVQFGYPAMARGPEPVDVVGLVRYQEEEPGESWIGSPVGYYAACGSCDTRFYLPDSAAPLLGRTVRAEGRIHAVCGEWNLYCHPAIDTEVEGGRLEVVRPAPTATEGGTPGALR